MKKLIEGIVQFRSQLSPEKKAFFEKLSKGQNPDALFITCSDSRVVPEHFVSTNPGDLFVIRNVGNLVPKYSQDQRDTSVAAALEYSINQLNVSDVVVCGHSGCGAMQAICSGVDQVACPRYSAWLKYGEPALDKVSSEKKSDVDEISKANVLLQMENVLSYPTVQKKKVRVHGWWFDIAQANVYCYEEAKSEFVVINEDEAKTILARLS